MKVLAPIVLILALSGALYKTKEVWPKADYDAAADAKKKARAKAKPAAASS
jgi:hypothetical protein